jgi:hypothetical protein
LEDGFMLDLILQLFSPARFSFQGFVEQPREPGRRSLPMFYKMSLNAASSCPISIGINLDFKAHFKIRLNSSLVNTPSSTIPNNDFLAAASNFDNNSLPDVPGIHIYAIIEFI